MLSFRTKGTDIAWRLMHQAMAYHFVLPLESFASFGPRTRLHGAIVWSVLTVYVRMRAIFMGEYVVVQL